MEFKEYLAAVKERTDKTTPGPWLCEQFGRNRWSIQTPMVNGEADILANEVAPNDGRFMAASRSDVPKLLKIIDAFQSWAGPGQNNQDLFDRLERIASEP